MPDLRQTWCDLQAVRASEAAAKKAAEAAQRLVTASSKGQLKLVDGEKATLEVQVAVSMSLHELFLSFTCAVPAWKQSATGVAAQESAL